MFLMSEMSPFEPSEEVELDDELLEGAHWQVAGPRPFPTGTRIDSSTETYAAGMPPQEATSWVIEEARRQFKERQSA